jgi:hypothetical protein
MAGNLSIAFWIASQVLPFTVTAKLCWAYSAASTIETTFNTKPTLLIKLTLKN